MKRFFAIIVAVLSVMTAMSQSSGIILSFNKGEQLKYYKYDQIGQAVNDAEVNDTIYFGTGEFDLRSLPEHGYSSYRCINKPLVFIGSGAHDGGTKFKNDYASRIYLKVDSLMDESKRIFSFEGISINGSVVVPHSNIKQLKFSNTKIETIQDRVEREVIEEHPYIDELIVDRCSIHYLRLDSCLTKHVSVNNSKLQDVYGGCDSSTGVATFDHCYIAYLQENFIGLVQHSIIYRANYTGSQTSLENCQYRDVNSAVMKDECTQILNGYESDIANLDNDPSSLGMCNDGTLYGTLGGKTPYTLYPSYPTADTSVDPDTNKAKSNVDYDDLNKKLTITVKRLGE